jgi:hypothetical protein
VYSQTAPSAIAAITASITIIRGDWDYAVEASQFSIATDGFGSIV